MTRVVHPGGNGMRVVAHKVVRVFVMVCLTVGVGGCVPSSRAENGAVVGGHGKPVVVTTSPLLADIVENVGGQRVDVTSLVPLGGALESYEPTLHDARLIAGADVALSHYPFFESSALGEAVSVSTMGTPRHVSVTEELVRYSAHFVTRIEDPTLDAMWLGFSSPARDVAPSADVRQWVSVTGVEGPGEVVGYVRGALGTASVLFSSLDGFDEASGFATDTLDVPPGAHHHVSWAFTEPGIYHLSLRAQRSEHRAERPITLGAGVLVLAVGVAPGDAPGERDPLSSGHVDISVGGSGDGLALAVSDDGDDGHDHAADHHVSVSLDDVVITVPAHTLAQADIPTSSGDLFAPGTVAYQLPQAVLGRSLHGEIDPALWLDPHNVTALATLICDELVRVDPAGAAEYHSALELYNRKVLRADRYATARLASIPTAHRQLVTEFDSVRYLAKAYDFDVAAVATPRRGIDPSLTHRRSVLQTITGLSISAVFAEENSHGGEPLLTDIARHTDTRVCHLVTSAGLSPKHPTVLDAMSHNADTIAHCLSE